MKPRGSGYILCLKLIHTKMINKQTAALNRFHSFWPQRITQGPLKFLVTAYIFFIIVFNETTSEKPVLLDPGYICPSLHGGFHRLQTEFLKRKKHF